MTPMTQNKMSPISDPSATSSPAAAVGTVAGAVVVDTVAGVVVVAFTPTVTLVENEVRDVGNGGPGKEKASHCQPLLDPQLLSQLLQRTMSSKVAETRSGRTTYRVRRWMCQGRW